MKRRVKVACLSAAVAASSLGITYNVSADILQWDASGNSAPSYTDGGGTWDNSTPQWVDLTTNTEVAWTDGNTAQFGNPSPTASTSTNTPYEIDIASNVTTQDINLGTGSTGVPYAVITDFGGSGASLTVNGNITKDTPAGLLQFDMYSSNLTLGPGNHTIAANDTGGDAAPEILFDAPIAGSGNVIIDNGSFAQWGTTAFNYANSYSGTTLVNKGRLILGDVNSLGSSSMTTIANQGSLSIGGDIGALPTNENQNFTINQPITITRNTYTGADYSDYPDALVSANTGQPNTVVSFTNLTIDSTDARISANTSTIAMNNPLVAGADVPGTAMADFDGDFAGFVDLNADNSVFGAAGNAIGIMGGVEVNASTIQELGGNGSKLVLNGGFLHITSALVSSDPNIVNNFGAGTSHNINTSAVSTGVDLDSGTTFNVSNLSGGGVGERGTGTLNFSGTNNFSSGNPFFDGGTINFVAGSSTSFGSIGLRSPVVYINGAVTTTLGGNENDFGASSNGTNGGPDITTVNISSTGSLAVAGLLFLGRNPSTSGTINQTGGSLTINHSGNFGFVIADGRNDVTGSPGPTSYYNLSSGTFSSPNGEIYVGEGSGNGVPGVGYWNQTGGTATFGTWFVVGREGAMGTVTISGGSLTKTGVVGADNAGNIQIGENSANVDSITVSGTGTLTENDGEFWVGNNSGVGVLNIGTAAGALTNADATASVTVNNWFAVGRNGTSTGTVNLYDGTLTQATAQYLDISGDGGSPTGTINVYGGTLNAYQVLIGENGSGHGTLNIYGGNVNFPNNTVLANSGTVSGTVNLSGGTLTAYGFQAHNGLQGESGGTGVATFDWNGGTLVEARNNTTGPLVGAAITSIVSAGGAIINTNGFSPTVSSALTHDSSVSGADGGLTKLGLGTLTSSGNNTYTGPTIVKAGTLALTGTDTFANGEPLNLAGGGATITMSHPLSGYLAAIQTGYNQGAWNGTSSSIPYITSSFAHTHPGTGVGYNLSGGVLTLEATWLGDTNLDGIVNTTDLAAFTPMASGGTWATGDFNYDGAVNADDFSLAQLGIFESNGANISTVVPEPAALGLLSLPLLVGLNGRRRRNAVVA